MSKYKSMQELFSSEKRWCKFRAHDEYNDAYCLIGALYEVYRFSDNLLEIDNKIQDYIKEVYHENHISIFNDMVATFKDIRKLVETLDI